MNSNHFLSLWFEECLPLVLLVRLLSLTASPPVLLLLLSIISFASSTTDDY